MHLQLLYTMSWVKDMDKQQGEMISMCLHQLMVYQYPHSRTRRCGIREWLDDLFSRLRRRLMSTSRCI